MNIGRREGGSEIESVTPLSHTGVHRPHPLIHNSMFIYSKRGKHCFYSVVGSPGADTYFLYTLCWGFSCMPNVKHPENVRAAPPNRHWIFITNPAWAPRDTRFACSLSMGAIQQVVCRVDTILLRVCVCLWWWNYATAVIEYNVFNSWIRGVCLMFVEYTFQNFNKVKINICTGFGVQFFFLQIFSSFHTT